MASFFVSRVDTAVDPLLLSTVERWPGSPKAETALSLIGKLAVANARLAYGRFGEIFSISAVEGACGCAARGCSGPCGRAPGRRTRNTPT